MAAGMRQAVNARKPVQKRRGYPPSTAATNATTLAQSVINQNAARRHRRAATHPMAADIQNVASAAATANPRVVPSGCGGGATQVSSTSIDMPRAYLSWQNRSSAAFLDRSTGLVA